MINIETTNMIVQTEITRSRITMEQSGQLSLASLWGR